MELEGAAQGQRGGVLHPVREHGVFSVGVGPWEAGDGFQAER